MAQEFDAVAYKETTRQQWQNAAAAWHRWTPTLQAWLGPVTNAMLDMADLDPGDRVLDLAAGAGEPSLSAAERVGRSGHVLATDISSNILEFAQQTARELGLTNFETRVMDGENPDLPDESYDAVLSRLGLIYFPDRKGALRAVHRMLKTGGRVVLAGFSTPDQNRFFSIPISIIRRRAQLAPPAPGLPGPFSLGAPGVMEEMLRGADFTEVTAQAVRTPLRLASAAECVRFERESFGALQQMLAALPSVEQDASWDEIEGELRAFEGDAGFEASAELILGAGTK
ncbi:MAG TPA: methyltransferase domain-containing protein [Candidatus Dormibacteraeota bacterium]|nr:methyltransferase domain-containing protein [Candidatus Dormibacteraeota bacterium]